MTGDRIQDPQPVGPRVTVVGIGADGWEGLGEAVRRLIEDAPLIIAGHRQQTLLPDIPGQDRRRWPTPMLPSLAALLDEYRDRQILVVASGDPLLSGVGTTLIELLGSEQVRVVPALSSVTLARARMGWSAESTDVLTLVGRDPHRVLGSVSPGRRLIALSSDEHTPGRLAALLVRAGYGPTRMTVLGDLGARDETRITGTAADWSRTDVPRLNLVCLEPVADPGTTVLPAIPGLPDEAFDNDGQLTKRDVRAAALARLGPVPGQLLWDVGAGAGSVAIEWMRVDARCEAIAVERNEQRVARIIRNADNLGVPGLRVISGSAPSALAGLPDPHAVFVGGGATTAGVLQTCWVALRPGGRLVVHAVTLETESVVVEKYKSLGGELVRLSIEHAAAIGSFTGWTPSRAVTQWSIVKSGRQS